LGQTGPWKPDGWPGNEVGWSFHPDAWGRGYATEAATAAMDWALQATPGFVPMPAPDADAQALIDRS
ncbi:GNAT family N-acetyltransferase, partial [Acinetobacter baumannii]|nr:GNAT family N-acetyltransferase [Acinetobacter baumannii]